MVIIHHSHHKHKVKFDVLCFLPRLNAMIDQWSIATTQGVLCIV